MTVEVVEIKTNKALKAFINFPLKLYKDSPYYVPSIFNDEMNTLRADRNPALKESRARYWLAYQDGKIVGRIAAIIN